MSALREKITVWMRDEKIGPIPHLLLLILSLFYGAAVRARLYLYAVHLLWRKRLPCVVVSVGNITVGGTGKTPVTMYLADYFKNAGKKVVVLSRGYGSTTKGVKVVSDGVNVLLDPAEAGDEPFMMAERLKGIPVVISPDRVKGGRMAIERFSPDVIVLDDGYQHIRLKRDVNILLVDSVDGFGNGFLLPRGILREPLRGIRRADAAMVKGGNLRRQDKELLKEYEIPVLSFEYRPSSVIEVKLGVEFPIDMLKDKRVVAVAGVANPNPFFKSIEKLGANVLSTLAYPDHHEYTDDDIDDIAKAAKGADIVLTTEKDAVKLRALSGGRLPLFAMRIEVEIKNTDGLSRLFTRFVNVKKTAPPKAAAAPEEG